MRAAVLTHRFVDRIPDNLEEATVYVCVLYATVLHKCGCGCGREVVTPLSPADWSLTFDGETVSLSPSVGNWSFECRSHYWIICNRVVWSRRWSVPEIEKGRAADRARRQRAPKRAAVIPSVTSAARDDSWRSRLTRWRRRLLGERFDQ